MDEILSAALAFVLVIGVLRKIAPTTWRAKRPLSCPLCLGFWSAVAKRLFDGNLDVAAAVGGAVFLCFTVVDAIAGPPLPPDLPQP